MGIEVTAVCDGNNCEFGAELNLTYFEPSGYKEVFADFGWSYDSDSDLCYCDVCVKKMKRTDEL